MKKISTIFCLLIIIFLGSFFLLGLHNDSSSSANDKNVYKDIKTIHRSFRHSKEKLC